MQATRAGTKMTAMPGAALGWAVLLCLVGGARAADFGASIKARTLYGSGSPTNIVRFADAALSSAVRLRLGLPRGESIRAGHCRAVRRLDLSGRGIRKLAGIEAFAALRSLDLSHNSIERFESVRDLWDLEYLDLGHNRVTNLDGVSGMAGLKFLDASHNQLPTLKPLAKRARHGRVLKVLATSNMLDCGLEKKVIERLEQSGIRVFHDCGD